MTKDRLDASSFHLTGKTQEHYPGPIVHSAFSGRVQPLIRRGSVGCVCQRVCGAENVEHDDCRGV